MATAMALLYERKKKIMYKHEKWNTHPVYSKYEISSDGRVRSSKKNWHGGKRILKPNDNGQGYQAYYLVDDNGNRKKVYAQELVLTAFIGPRPEGYEAAHGNAIPSDNRLVNVRWATKDENKADKALVGTMRFDPEIVLIKAMLDNGMARKDVAETLGTSVSLVGKVANGVRKPFVQKEPSFILRAAAGFMADGHKMVGKNKPFLVPERYIKEEVF